MTDHALTLMAVHAHPDDEASSTGGLLARYADEGVRTVVVTCTDGRCGDGPGGVKPGEPGHDPDAVVATRAGELAASCAILNVEASVPLGYHDSGMMGWAANDAPGSFWRTPVAEAGARLADLMRRYRPDVVVTYDENGFYGHPDHIQAHRVTMVAVEQLAEDERPAKVYWTTAAHSTMARMGELVRASGGEWDETPDDPPIGLPDDEIDVWVDTSAYLDQHFSALAAHASQLDNAFFIKLGPDAFGKVLGVSNLVRVRDTTAAPLPETDLFAGLR